jgi:hypothetical protein
VGYTKRELVLRRQNYTRQKLGACPFGQPDLPPNFGSNQSDPQVRSTALHPQITASAPAVKNDPAAGVLEQPPSMLHCGGPADKPPRRTAVKVAHRIIAMQ